MLMAREYGEDIPLEGAVKIFEQARKEFREVISYYSGSSGKRKTSISRHYKKQLSDCFELALILTTVPEVNQETKTGEYKCTLHSQAGNLARRIMVYCANRFSNTNGTDPAGVSMPIDYGLSQVKRL